MTMWKPLLGFVAFTCWLVSTSLAQGGRGRDDTCPYCTDEAVMKAAGIVGHGPFPCAETTSTKIEETIVYEKFYWLETTHLVIGSTLPKYPVPQREKKFLRAELEELAKVFPKVDPKTRTLDPWLRIHLHAFRCENLYAKFQKLMGVTDADFPGARTKRYMGEGTYLGQKAKYEVMLHHRVASHQDFLRTFLGSTQEAALWENYTKTDSLGYSLPGSGVRGMTGSDLQIATGSLHNLTHCLVCGYRHYNYDIPVWLCEGLAHLMQQEFLPEYPFFCFGEGTPPQVHTASKWKVAVYRMVTTSDAASLAELQAIKNYGQITGEGHLTAYSVVDYLIHGFDDDGVKFRDFLDKLKSRVNLDGKYIDESVDELFRKGLFEQFGGTILNFDEKWRTWVSETYPRR